MDQTITYTNPRSTTKEGYGLRGGNTGQVIRYMDDRDTVGKRNWKWLQKPAGAPVIVFHIHVFLVNRGAANFFTRYALQG